MKTDTHGFDFDTVIQRRGTGAIKWDLVGPNEIPMWVADMDFAAPEEVQEALRRRVEHPVFGYTETPDEYFDAFLEWERRRNGWEITREQVVVSGGVMPSIRYAIDCFTAPGDGVIIQPPVYHPFFTVVSGRGRRLIENPLRRNGERYEMDFEGLERCIDAGTRMLVLCSPHNPVGRVWEAAELGTLAEICASANIVVVSDEIHSDIIMPGNRFVPFGMVSEQASRIGISCRAPSKTFNIAGLSMCSLIIPDDPLAAAFRKELQAGNLGLPNLLSAVAATAAYRHGGPWLDALLRYLEDNYRFMCDYLAGTLPQLRVTPIQGTYIAWVDFSGLGLSDEELSKRLREIAGVRLSEGPGFGAGGSGYQRINFACPRLLLEQGLERIVKAFDAESFR